MATTANITIATALNAGDSLDGVTLAADDRVLVKDQSTGSQNGIYVVSASPARAYDVSTDDQDIRGALIYVREGTAGGGKLFKNTNTAAVTIGTTALTFAEVSGGSGAPTTADYLVGTAQGGLSAEIVVGTSPGGELGGTWASPTVDATHSGSAHADFIANSLLTTQDDIIVRDGTGPARLGKGSDGQVLTVDPTTHHLVWATPTGGAAALDDLTDVDTTGVGDGDVIAFDSGTSTWLPVAPGTPTIDWGEDADITTQDYDDVADAGVLDEVARADHLHGMPSAGGGGGLTQAYAGYNTIGGSWETMTSARVVAKKITLANDCLLTDIEAYLDANANDSAFGFSIGLFDDNSGTPDHLLLRAGTPYTVDTLFDNAAGGGGINRGRWYGLPIGRWLTAGDYWIAVSATNQQGTTLRIAYDATGGDRYYSPGFNGFADWGFYTPTTTSNQYSIRANTIR